MGGSIGAYLLNLDLTNAGFDASVLSEFRTRLIDQHAEELLLEKMLTLFGQKGWRQQPVADSVLMRAHVLAKIRADPPRAVRLGNDACRPG